MHYLMHKRIYNSWCKCRYAKGKWEIQTQWPFLPLRRSNDRDKPIFTDLIKRLHGKTQNQNGSVNRTTWARFWKTVLLEKFQLEGYSEVSSCDILSVRAWRTRYKKQWNLLDEKVVLEWRNKLMNFWKQQLKGSNREKELEG